MLLFFCWTNHRIIHFWYVKRISINELGDRNKYRRLMLRKWEETGHTPENAGREVEKVEERNKRMTMGEGEGL